MSPASVVVTTGHAASTPGGLPSTSSPLVVAATGPATSIPQGAHDPRVQLPDLQLWHLLEDRHQRIS
jgi:hypothetical protein